MNVAMYRILIPVDTEEPRAIRQAEFVPELCAEVFECCLPGVDVFEQAAEPMNLVGIMPVIALDAGLD